VVIGSFKAVECVNVGLGDILRSLPAGVIDRVDLVVLILLLEEAFFVIEKNGCLASWD